MELAESHGPSPREIFYEFSPSLVLIRAFLSGEYRQEHLQLEEAGKLSHSASDDEVALLRDLEVRRTPKFGE